MEKKNGTNSEKKENLNEKTRIEQSLIREKKDEASIPFSHAETEPNCNLARPLILL